MVFEFVFLIKKKMVSPRHKIVDIWTVFFLENSPRGGKMEIFGFMGGQSELGVFLGGVWGVFPPENFEF